MSVAITIREVPDEVRNELAARAARSGRSLQEYLKATLVSIASRPDPADLMAQVEERLATSPTRIDVAAVLEDVAADRR